MNSWQRVMNTIEGKEVDRIPNMNLVMSFAAKQLGVSYGNYVSDYRLLTQGALRCHETFGMDMVCVISDPMREAEGLGAQVVIPEDGVPYSPQPLLRDLRDIAALKVAEPSKCRRMNDRLEAVRFLKERVGNEVPVVGWVEGAVAESCDLMNMSEVLMNLLDEPEEMRYLLELCCRQSTLFAKAQIEAGAHFIGVGDAASSLIGPVLYEQFALPFQQKLIGDIHAMGAKVKLHICGNLTPVLGLAGQSGADIIDLDHMVDLEQAARVLPPATVLCGNYDPVSVLLQGDENFVRSEVRRCLNISNTHRIIVSAGCEVPKETPKQNMTAVMDEIQSQGREIKLQ